MNISSLPRKARPLALAIPFFVAAAAATEGQPPASQMLEIPAGELQTLACPDLARICDPSEYVERTVPIKAFKLATMEVTFAQWDACVADGGCHEESSGWAYRNREVHPPCVAGEVCQYPFDEGWGRGERPVVHVSWEDVQRYLSWLNAKTGQTYRLPTSEEWEYAALAGADSRFPWGDALDPEMLNCNGCAGDWGGVQSAPVGSFPANRFGLHDMLGNVSEWVSSCVPLNEPGSQQCTSYLYRGGAWSFDAPNIDPRRVNWNYAEFRAPFLGFRVAQ